MAQESLNSLEDTGCAPPEGPILCAQDCGFFGTAENLNLCSQCYQIHMKKHEETAESSTLTTGEKGILANTESAFLTTDRSEPTSASVTPPLGEGLSTTSHGTPQGGGSSSTPTEAVLVDEVGKRNSHQGPKRCFSCRKRVGLTGFDCKCGNLFCSKHRYSDEHNCTFDYKSAGRDAIAQANPVVKAEKIEKV